MAFPKRLLTANEEIVLDLRPHWVMLVGPLLTTILLLAAAVAAGWGLEKTSLATKYVTLGPIVGFVVGWCIFALPRIATWFTTQFALTNERLIARSGVIAKRSKEIPLEAVNDISFTQSLLARILGAGTLVVESAGERGQESFKNIRCPEEVQKQIYDASAARKGLN